MNHEDHDRALHEAGHLVVLHHVFGGLRERELVINFVTIEPSGNSGGAVNWNPGAERDPHKQFMVAAAGFFANVNDGMSLELAKAAALDDFEQLDALKLTAEKEQELTESLICIILQLTPVIRAVADELRTWRTFFGIEGLGVVEAALTDDEAVRRTLAKYRAERDESGPHNEWGERGPWYETFDEWCLRTSR